MRLYRLSLAALAVFTVAFCGIHVSSAHAQEIVRDVKVVGVQRIEPETVLSYMDLKAGDRITPDALDNALKSLFRTGLFADVSVRQSGPGTVEVSVIENPIVNEIAFEGNDKLKDEDLLAEIQTRPRQVFTRTKVQSDVNRLYQVYRRNGRFSVAIEPKVIKLEQNRVNLVFEINEGNVTKVNTIRFIGNKRFDDDSLRSEISTKENRWYSFISADDRYDPDRLAYDQELLRRFYLANGYADFRLISAVAELSNDRKSFYITFTLEEGERYKVNEIVINSALKNFDAGVLKPQIGFKKGDWYDANAVQTSIEAMTSALGDLQYAFVAIKPRIERNRTDYTVDVFFDINETPRVFVERIDIHGNMRTEDQVIRRRLELVEGDPFSKTKLAKSEQKVKNLDYFETVEVKTQPGSAPDKTVVDIGVAEKSTGELSIGAGFSTSDGPLADLRVRERNLLGKGYEGVLAATIAGERTEFDASFTDPYFLGRDLSAGIDAFHVTRDLQDESSYDQRRTGGGLRFGYPLSEKWRQNLRYTYEHNVIDNIDDDASLFIQAQEGKRVTSAIGQRIIYDDRDSTVFPTEGLLGWFDTEFAGIGGDAEYVSGKLGSQYYYPVMPRWIWSVMGEVGGITGWSDGDVKINERFFLGGATLRGFETAGVGPRDLVTEDSLGGNFFYRGSVETSFPIGLPDELGVLGHAFSDFGSLWDLDETSLPGTDIVDENAIRVSAGLGLSWRSPMGPIRVDFGFPIVKKDYDKDESFRFSFGTRF